MGSSSRGALWRAGRRWSLNGSGRSGRCWGVRTSFPCALAAVRAQEGVSARRKTGRTVAGRGARWLRGGARCWGPSVPRSAVLRVLCAPRVLRVHPAVPRALLDGAAGDPEETHVRVPPAPCCPRCAALSCRAVAAVLGASPLCSLLRPLSVMASAVPSALQQPSPFSAGAHTHTHSTPRGPRARPAPGALRARPSGDRGALRRTGAPRRVVSPGGGRGATGHGAGARGRAGREAGCALRGGQRRAPGRGGAALPGRATAGLAARGGRSSRTGPPCSGPGASRVKLTCLTTV